MIGKGRTAIDIIPASRAAALANVMLRTS